MKGGEVIGRGVGRVSAARSGAVEGASNVPGASIQDVCVDHRRGHVLVAQQLLDGADVIAVLQQVGSE